MQVILILAYVGLFVIASRVLTVEADEAWTLMSTYKAFGIAVPNTSAVANPTVTSGGLHALIHGLLGLASTQIWLHRSISLLALGSLLALTFAIFKRCGANRPEAFAGCLFVLNSAALVFQSSLATAEIIATVLVVAALWILTRLQFATDPEHPDGSQMSPFTTSIASGGLLGLAFSTRVDSVVVLPAVLVYAFFSIETRRRKVEYTILIAVVSLFVMGLFVIIYIVSFGMTDLNSFTSCMTRATGVGRVAKGSGGVLRDFVIGNDLVPYVALALSILAYRLHTPADRRQRGLRFGMLLLGCGCSNLLLWIEIAPISHARYLYPGIPMLWLSGGLVGLSALRKLKSDDAVAACHIAIILVSIAQLSIALYFVIAGEALNGVYQLARQAPLEVTQTPFRAFRDQEKTAEFVRALPPDARLLSFLPEAAYPITYLSWRPIGSVTRDWTPPGKKHIVFVPNQRTIWPFPAASTIWLSQFAFKEFQSGDFVVYEIKDDAPPPHR